MVSPARRTDSSTRTVEEAISPPMSPPTSPLVSPTRTFTSAPNAIAASQQPLAACASTTTPTTTCISAATSKSPPPAVSPRRADLSIERKRAADIARTAHTSHVLQRSTSSACPRNTTSPASISRSASASDTITSAASSASVGSAHASYSTSPARDGSTACNNHVCLAQYRLHLSDDQSLVLDRYSTHSHPYRLTRTKSECFFHTWDLQNVSALSSSYSASVDAPSIALSRQRPSAGLPAKTPICTSVDSFVNKNLRLRRLSSSVHTRPPSALREFTNYFSPPVCCTSNKRERERESVCVCVCVCVMVF
jgi:hypothetical protein